VRERILSLCPALPGWSVVYGLDDSTVLREPIACWALHEWKDDRGQVRTEVVALINADDGYLTPADELTNPVLGIEKPGDARDWTAAATSHRKPE